jgi:phenylpropionate dioxygenase-like ring-hydroxylating dioxygenase large terminal subunit
MELSAHRFTPQSGLGLGGVPLHPYRSAAYFQEERDKVFGRAWLFLGLASEVSNPGDFITKYIDVTETSLILVRDTRGAIRVFYNSCSHRGSTVVTKANGNAPAFVCPYHNWSYRNNGELLGIPDQATFFSVDKKKCGLSEIKSDLWGDFVFINLDKDSDLTLDEFLGDLKVRMDGINFIFNENPISIEAKINANWKVVSDAFLETYHIPAIHPETIGATFASNENPHARLLDAELLGDHALVSMYGNPGFQLKESHRLDLIAQRSTGAGNVISANASAEVAQFLDHPAVNPTKTPAWSMDAIKIFPNTHIDMGPGGFWIHQFWPVDHKTTKHQVKFYMAPARDARMRLQQELYIARVMDILAEDVKNTERTQQGIVGGRNSEMQLQDNEIAIRHNVDRLERWVRAKSAREALHA